MWVFGLLEQFDGEHAGGGDAKVDDRPCVADLVLVQPVAVGGEGDDTVEHLFCRVQHVLLVLLRAVIGKALEQESVQ